jgi:hypothetical protein
MHVCCTHQAGAQGTPTPGRHCTCCLEGSEMELCLWTCRERRSRRGSSSSSSSDDRAGAAVRHAVGARAVRSATQERRCSVRGAACLGAVVARRVPVRSRSWALLRVRCTGRGAFLRRAALAGCWTSQHRECRRHARSWRRRIGGRRRVVCAAHGQGSRSKQRRRRGGCNAAGLAACYVKAAGRRAGIEAPALQPHQQPRTASSLLMLQQGAALGAPWLGVPQDGQAGMQEPRKAAGAA